MAAITLDEYVKNFREKLDRWPAYDELWAAANKIAEKKFTSTNSDYAAAQRVLREFYVSYDGTQTVNDLQTFVTVRLNSAKAPNCA